jgi:lauroyl/myristoyl acyltransferase
VRRRSPTASIGAPSIVSWTAPDVTSNKRVSEWAELFGEEVLAAAILYRLLHNAEVLTINDSSYRLRGRMEMITMEGGEAEAGADN